jgi:outer membrane receptor protein involved in Fe transport
MRRPILLSTLLLLLLNALPAAAQDRGSISGKVSDRKSGHALAFASVTVVEAKRGGLTDSEGQFLVSGIPAGTYEVRVQFLGYKADARAGVVVTAGKATLVNFVLDEIVVREEKAVEVTAERRLVEARQGTTVRSVSANEIRNLPVQTIGEVLQQQAGVTTENDQIHVRGGRADETIFVVNGVANRDLVTGQSTAGQLNARSVAEVNVATGAYDVRYGNALSGVVEVKLKEGGDKASAGLTLTSGTYGGRNVQAVIGGPDPLFRPLFRLFHLPGTVSGLLDISGSLYETRFLAPNAGNWFSSLFQNVFTPEDHPRLRSSYEDSFFGIPFHYGDFFSPSQDNRWAARYGLTWKPGERDKVTLDFSKRIAIDQGFSRTFITATGDVADPSFPWAWDHRITHAGTIFEDNAQTSLEWRRTLSTTGFTTFQLSRYFYAQREDVLGKNWSQYEQPDDFALPPLPDGTPDPRRNDYFVDTGDDNAWQDRRSTTYGIQWSLTQRIKRHELEVGLEHQFQSVQYVTIQDPWTFDPSGLGDAHDLWEVHPWIGDLYLRDRLEYEGFTANIGLRADYWFVGREAERAVADTSNPNVSSGVREDFYNDTRSFFGRRYKLHISPRVIVAHPITANSSFFFNYGEFTQVPSYRYVYSKLTSISSEAFPTLGNPDLNPQVSVNYEVGAKHQFLPTAAVNLTFFQKDIYDYPTATTFKRSQGTSLVDIFVYLNGHFARSKGFEIELEKRRSASGHWSGKLLYTFSQTKGKSSDPNEQRVVEENGGNAAETRLSETFVSWNRPHKLGLNFDLRSDERWPEGTFGWLRQSGLNVYMQGESGRAYTPIFTAIGPNGLPTVSTNQSATPYSENAKVQFTTDMRLNHYFRLAGHRVDLSLQGLNIFNNYLVYRVDPVTGSGRVWGQGSYDPVLYPSINQYTYISQVLDPSNYGPGAQYRLSLDYDF